MRMAQRDWSRAAETLEKWRNKIRGDEDFQKRANLPLCRSKTKHRSGTLRVHITQTTVNPFTPESDQCQNSPAASQEIWHHTVWRTWLFIAYSDEKWLYYKFSLHHSYNRFLKGWENTLFELRSERVKYSWVLDSRAEMIQSTCASACLSFAIWMTDLLCDTVSSMLVSLSRGPGRLSTLLNTNCCGRGTGMDDQGHNWIVNAVGQKVERNLSVYMVFLSPCMAFALEKIAHDARNTDK